MIDAQRTEPSTLDIHRLLDEAFAGIEPTPEVQDLKEELRADLVAKTADLEHSGVPAREAAAEAIRGLGDIRSLVDELTSGPGRGPSWSPPRVRPAVAFVIRTVVLSLLGLAAMAVVVVAAVDSAIPLAAMEVAAAVAAVVAGFVVGDSLRQETTSNYPLPTRRALGFGVAKALAVAALGLAAPYLRDRAVPWLVVGGLVMLAAIVAFTYLAATQTNRHKPWVVRLQRGHEEAADRFSRDPVAAARFGVYTVAIWIVTLAAFVGLTIAVGWAWSWLALVAGLVAFLVTLARMLFAPDGQPVGNAPASN